MRGDEEAGDGAAVAATHGAAVTSAARAAAVAAAIAAVAHEGFSRIQRAGVRRGLARACVCAPVDGRCCCCVRLYGGVKCQ